MPSFAMTVPYMRTSPLRIPRRDLVLGRADSLFLRVTVVDSDNPCAQALDLTGGLGGPVLQMLVWPDQHYRSAWDYGTWWDYGASWPRCGPAPVLWAGQGAVSDAIGAFDIAFPTASMSCWPRRCAYALQLDYDGGGSTDLLAEEYFNVQILRPALCLARDHAHRPGATGADRRRRQRHSSRWDIIMSGIVIDGIRIIDMPDLGAVNDSSSVVGERAGSGRFSAPALLSYMDGKLNPERFPVARYGAVGDGVTDDTYAIQAAIDAAGGHRGGVVTFDAKPYVITGTLNIGNGTSSAVSTYGSVVLAGVAPPWLPPQFFTGYPITSGTVLAWRGAAGG